MRPRVPKMAAIKNRFTIEEKNTKNNKQFCNANSNLLIICEVNKN